MTKTITQALARAIVRLRPRFRDATPGELALEANVLLAHALGCTRAQLMMRADRVLSRQECARFQVLIRRRRQRVPSAYLRGEQEFWSLSFAVGPGVLVPRPETELLVERVLAYVPQNARILDVGTGSGCIAISLARELPAARIVALDRSPVALEYARLNALRHGVESRIEFVEADLRAASQVLADREFDVVVSNPPYVESDAICDEIAHEPRVALVGDGCGFPAVYHELAGLAMRVAPRGCLLVEVGVDQSDEVAKILRSATSYGSIECVRDAAGIPRCIIARR